MPRTTIDLDPTVLRELRRRGKRERRSMGEIASETLMRAFAESTPPEIERFDWQTGGLGKTLVDLEDKEAVRAVLDAP